MLLDFPLPFRTIKQSSAIFSLGHFNLFSPVSVCYCWDRKKKSEMDKTECQNVNVSVWKRNCERLQFCFCHLYHFSSPSSLFFYFAFSIYFIWHHHRLDLRIEKKEVELESWIFHQLIFSIKVDLNGMKKKAFNRISIISGPDSYSIYGVPDRNEGIFSCLLSSLLRLAF